MSTINIVTSALSTTNRVRVSLYKADDPLAAVAEQTQDAPHAETKWTFTELMPGDNYLYKWVELDGSNNVIQLIGSQNFTVPASGSIEVKEPIDIIADTTPGFASGTNTAVFDGSNGSIDLRGWTIDPELPGAGSLRKDFNGPNGYSWDIITGTFMMLEENYQFQPDERYKIRFVPRVIPSTPIIVRDAWSSNLYINDDTILTAGDFGKNVIVKGNDTYLKITLPSIASVTPNKLLHVECTGDVIKCAEIAVAGGNGNLITYPKNGKSSLFICSGESLAIYREKVDDTTSYWRVKFADGQFKSVGEFVSEYANEVLNKIPCDGDLYNKLDYARLYNDYILNLGASQVVAFSDWGTGNNKYKFSLADPSTGDFHTPDLSNLYERVSGDSEAAAYLAGQVGPHSHDVRTGNFTGGTQTIDRAVSMYDTRDVVTPIQTLQTGTNIGTENRPNSYVVRKYVRV